MGYYIPDQVSKNFAFYVAKHLVLYHLLPLIFLRELETVAASNLRKGGEELEL